MKEPYYNANNNTTRNISIKVCHINGIIAAICEHIEADKITVSVYAAVSTYKSLKLWVIVTAVEVVEACFCVGVIATIAERGCVGYCLLRAVRL